MKPVNIEARDLPHAWYKCVFELFDVGRGFEVERGSYEGDKRLEFDYITIHIKHPYLFPLIPDIPERCSFGPPVDEQFINNYLPYLLSPDKQDYEAYTYGQRLSGFPIYLPGLKEFRDHLIDEFDIWRKNFKIFDGPFLNQIEAVIWTYKNKGWRNNQMVLQVAEPPDLLLKDPPCLRHIDTRIQDGVLHFFPYFRSWDLWNGFPANLAAIQLLKEYMANEIGVSDGEIVASSKGLHIYGKQWPMLEELRNKKLDERAEKDEE